VSRASKEVLEVEFHERSSHTITMSNFYDVICIGAGPTGLACAMDAKLAGLRPLVIDKGCLCNSLFHYPTNMSFFTTPERMEIGDLPMTTAAGKPTRAEALKYYRRAVEHFGIEVRQYEKVERIEGKDEAFTVHTTDQLNLHPAYHGRKIIIATGFYDRPNRLNVRGEELAHVSHYFSEAHPYWNREVLIVGGGNSAAEAALDLFRAGARVTIVHRGGEMSRSLKYWVKPDIENRIRGSEIRAMFNSRVISIAPNQVIVENGRNEEPVPASQVFALIGYHPDFDFLTRHGIVLDSDTKKPVIDPETLETNVPGIYVAGVVVGGLQTSRIFIENGRFHGRQIIAAITGTGKLLDREPVAPPGE
jgi:thioredoxin reductase (NADPH)